MDFVKENNNFTNEEFKEFDQTEEDIVIYRML